MCNKVSFASLDFSYDGVTQFTVKGEGAGVGEGEGAGAGAGEGEGEGEGCSEWFETYTGVTMESGEKVPCVQIKYDFMAEDGNSVIDVYSETDDGDLYHPQHTTINACKTNTDQRNNDLVLFGSLKFSYINKTKIPIDDRDRFEMYEDTLLESGERVPIIQIRYVFTAEPHTSIVKIYFETNDGKSYRPNEATVNTCKANTVNRCKVAVAERIGEPST
jgi:hypothetical protein